ncbi:MULTISPECIES: hypothetical protein [Methanobacterium]|jgi:hypothetical protein|uniref:Uncharacterized protein n=2 Tax=Methanobacterium veterum TaxID=408577 RepID=A0A9E5DN82_9EURY|nr:MULTISPECIES: hypothetical protein [Methanobacterium]MCZ3372152.1 hypothetical protein [Methanobacterium veterum]
MGSKMVSNKEISQRLRAKTEGMALSYLVCDTCGGYYELQPGESPESFDLECECGGQLLQSTSDSLISYNDEFKDYSSEIFLGYALIIFGGIFAFACGIYLTTRDDERANFHGKVIMAICLAPIIAVLAFLIFYKAFFH